MAWAAIAEYLNSEQKPASELYSFLSPCVLQMGYSIGIDSESGFPGFLLVVVLQQLADGE